MRMQMIIRYLSKLKNKKYCSKIINNSWMIAQIIQNKNKILNSMNFRNSSKILPKNNKWIKNFLRKMKPHYIKNSINKNIQKKIFRKVKKITMIKNNY